MISLSFLDSLPINTILNARFVGGGFMASHLVVTVYDGNHGKLGHIQPALIQIIVESKVNLCQIRTSFSN